MCAAMIAAQLAALLDMPCEQLTAVALERSTLKSATAVRAGVFELPAYAGG